MQPTDKRIATVEQWQALKGVMDENIGKAKVLTTDDYNYPTDNPTSIAIWLLEPGLYKIASGVSTRLSRTWSKASNGDFWFIADKGAKAIWWSGGSADYVRVVLRTDGSSIATYGNIDTANLRNDLIYPTAGQYALDAAQGKVLNDKIGGDLSNLTTTDKTSLINAINELAGQGGGFTAIDLADGDVNIWELDDGLYEVANTDTVFHYLNAKSNPTDSERVAFKGGAKGYLLVGSRDSFKTFWCAGQFSNSNAATGYNITWRNGYSSSSDGHAYTVPAAALNNLTSTDGTLALSANQGRVLKNLIDSIAIRGAGAPTTSTVGEVGQLYEDGTNGALYQLKSIDITVTPNTYNWVEVGGGGGSVASISDEEMNNLF